LFGDEGSGYAIAVAGLRAAAQAADGRGEPTRLVESIQLRLGADNPQQLVEAVYSPGTTRQRIAELSDVVFQASEQGDTVARRIILGAATELAAVVRTLVTRLSLPVGAYPLCVTGGVLLNHVALRQALEQELTKHGSGPESIVLVSDPVRGAVAMARKANNRT
jgi:N-acetylglucosamine kinase-like BadF-type ATPase